MAKYRFTTEIVYEVEAEDEEGAICQLTDLIHRDWPYYLDDGELVKLDEQLPESICDNITIAIYHRIV